MLVTGCSSGIGWATALTLRDQGWRVVPTARKADDLDRLRAEGFDPVGLDMADDASIEAAAAETLSRFPRLYGVVNNAGYGQPGAMEDVTRDQFRMQFQVNVVGLHDLTCRLLPALREAGSGRVVHISSVVGRVVLPFLGAYCASKHALEAMADAMRVELRNSGIRVILIEPGPIATRFRERAEAEAEAVVANPSSPHQEAYRKHLGGGTGEGTLRDVFRKPPEAVAETVARALTARWPRARYPVTVPAHVGTVVRRLVPTVAEDAIKGWAAGTG